MRTDFYAQVKAQVSAMEAAEAYGLEVRHGKARCVWHSDNHPSLSFKDNYCHCFSCNRGGSSIDLVMQLFALDAKEAAHKLNQDFALGLQAGAKPRTGKQLREAQKAAREAQTRNEMVRRIEAWFAHAHGVAIDHRWMLFERAGFVKSDGVENADVLLDWFEGAWTVAEKAEMYSRFRGTILEMERGLLAREQQN